MPSSVKYLRLLAAAILTTPQPFVAYADEYGSGPAVSGFNTKLSVEGGAYDGDGSGLLQGSLTTPLGHAFGLQFDGALGTVGSDVLGGGGVHLFTREPSSYLLGFYGSFHTWDSINISRFAAEGELYRGRFTLSGIAGLESVDVPSTKGGLTVLNTDSDHFFTELDLSYYPRDNVRLSVGYHYENEKSFGAAAIEYMPQWNGAPMSLFATGNFGESGDTQITAGIRLYLGADRNKTLIRRQREDDPGSYLPVFPSLVTQAVTTNFCPASGNFTLTAYPSCTCPTGTVNAGSDPFTDGKALGNCNSRFVT
jgi:hypothetical protein